MLDAPIQTTDSRIAALLLHHEIDQFNARYAAALDAQRLTEWTEMFTEDAFYLVTSRENIIGNLVVNAEDANGDIRAQANYVVLQVLFDRPDATLHQVGVYHDVFHRTATGLKLRERRCIYDNLLVPNALCIPV